MFFWNSLAFSMIQQMLAIGSLVPLPFLNPARTSESSQFTLLLKPGLENFEHHFFSMWKEYNCAVVLNYLWHWLWDEMKTDLFQSCGHCWVFYTCCHTECSTFTASSFRSWISSTGIPSPPLALFVVMFPKAHLTALQDVWLFATSWITACQASLSLTISWSSLKLRSI